MSIEAKNISLIYQGLTPVLNNISFKIDKGEYVGIIGHTGSGKTSLIQLIAGLIAPDSGKILIDYDDINQKSYNRTSLRQKIGIVFQYPEYQLFETTVERDVAFSLKHSAFSKKEIAKKVESALTLMNFNYDAIRKKSPLSLSGGERRRAAIAGVLVYEPQILIFDEPLAGLDPSSRHQFMELTKRLNENGTTIIVVSHNIDMLCEYAKRILVLNSGRLVSDLSASDTFADITKLSKSGIKAGQVRTTAQYLYDNKIITDPNIIRYDELLNAVTKALKKEGG